MQTMYELCKQVKQTSKAGKATKTSPSIVEGLVVEKPPLKTGLVQLTPGQILGCYVERLEYNDRIGGYQRDFKLPHVRRIAAAMARGAEVPEIALGLDGQRVFIDDGQQRACAAVIARKPLYAVIRIRSAEERRRRFGLQAQQRRISADVLALAGEGPAVDYVRAALEAKSQGRPHPWAELAGETGDHGQIGPHLFLQIVSAYALGLLVSPSALEMPVVEQRKAFRTEHADELAGLIRVFGTRHTNPLAYRNAAVRAITDTAVLAVRRNPAPADAAKRWARHMVTFDWAGHAWLTTNRPLRGVLVAHWNKRLAAASKIRLD